MQLSLRLQLKPSRSYFVFLASGHTLAGVAVCLLPLAGLLRGGMVLLLALLLLRTWSSVSRGLPGLLLRHDGKLEWHASGREPVLAEVGSETVAWPWLVILHLQTEAGCLRPQVLFADGLVGPDAHRQLRLWLRWRVDGARV
jgi:hypothetical protein